jgi:hypothetical protein
MDAQDASGLRFGPSTLPRKANEKIYMLKKDGPKEGQLGCGRALGAIELRWLPPGPSFLMVVPSMPRRAVWGCFGTLNAGRMDGPKYFWVKWNNGIFVRLRTCSVNVAEYHPVFLDGVARIHQF